MLLLGIGLSNGLHAQETMLATGGNGSGSGGTVSYSVGQVAYTSHTGTNGSVLQGVQQAFEISVITGIGEFEGIDLTVSAYPNPVTNHLVLKVGLPVSLSSQSLRYQLLDMSGKLLESKQVTESETSIGMSHLAEATYLVKVTEGNQVVKTFKIIKN
jgi:hypothetical protein